MYQSSHSPQRRSSRLSSSLSPSIHSPGDANSYEQAVSEDSDVSHNNFYTSSQSQIKTPAPNEKVMLQVNYYFDNCNIINTRNRSKSDQPKVSPGKCVDIKTSKSTKTKSNYSQICNWTVISILSLAGIIILSVLYFYSSKEDSKIDVGKRFDTLKSKFPSQQDLALWTKVFVALKHQSSNVSSLIFLYDGDERQTASCLANQILDFYVIYKNLKDKVVKGGLAEFQEDNDHGSIIKRLSDNLGEPAAMLLEDLDQVGPQAARALHVICDDVTTFKMPALYIFTLRITNLTTKEIYARKPESMARSILEEQWGSLEDYILKPLLARILGHVVHVNHEENYPCSELP